MHFSLGGGHGGGGHGGGYDRDGGGGGGHKDRRSVPLSDPRLINIVGLIADFDRELEGVSGVPVGGDPQCRRVQACRAAKNEGMRDVVERAR